MTPPRLASGIVVAALRKKAEVEGGSAMVLAKGDEVAGGILAIILKRNEYIYTAERRTDFDGRTYWDVNSDIGNRNQTEMLQLRKKHDPDLWIVELDIADAQRFTVEIASIC